MKGSAGVPEPPRELTVERTALPTAHQSRFRIWPFALAAALAWTALIAVALGWSVFDHWGQTLDHARHEAQISFQKEMLLRFWTDGHGGSAPATNNPPSSSALANPAAMLRQIRGQSTEPAGYLSRLTSVKPSRPEDTPDAWEAGALRAFAKGETEVASVATLEGRKYMRVMRPLVTEVSCLTCHDAADHKVGEILGGLSVAVPLVPLQAQVRSELTAQGIAYGVIWGLGLGVIGFGARRRQAHDLERARAETVVRESEVRYRTLADSGQTLIWTSGLDQQRDYCNQPWLTFTGRTLAQELGFIRRVCAWTHANRVASG